MTGSARRIESPTNAKIKAWRSLHKRRRRDESGLCLVEGVRELDRALQAGCRIDAVLIADDAAQSVVALAATIQGAGAALFELSAPAHSKVSLRSHPAEIIGVVSTPGSRLADVDIESPTLAVVADGIEKPGNIGAMIRSADGAGADILIVSDPVTDLGNPNVIRASQGTVFSFPVATGTASETSAWLEANGLTPIVAADEAATSLWETDLTGASAIVVGSEDKGVSPAWRSHQSISIPMQGMSDSLNASVAAAVILYEARRQRTASIR